MDLHVREEEYLLKILCNAYFLVGESSMNICKDLLFKGTTYFTKLMVKTVVTWRCCALFCTLQESVSGESRKKRFFFTIIYLVFGINLERWYQISPILCFGTPLRHSMYIISGFCLPHYKTKLNKEIGEGGGDLTSVQLDSITSQISSVSNL